MTATMVDFRSRMSEIESAVNRNEKVTVLRRNRPWAVLVSIAGSAEAALPVARRRKSRDFAACGMWSDRKDMEDPAAWVRSQRRDRRVI